MSGTKSIHIESDLPFDFDWNTAQILSFTPDQISFRWPDFWDNNTKNIIFGTTGSIPRRVGASIYTFEYYNIDARVECLSTSPEAAIIVFGFSKNNKIASSFQFIRFEKYILGTDIQKAFHCMKISRANSRRFLFMWFRDVKNSDYTPVVYMFKRICFGLAPAPFLLTVGPKS